MASSASRLAIVTGDHAPDLSEDGTRLAAALADRGVEAVPVLWTDESIAWGEYDGVLVRSCWDYPTDVARFRTMLAEIEAAGVPVCNPAAVIRWNLHKSYLTDLAAAGVRIPETTVLRCGADATLETVLRETGWEEVVYKPAVGAGSTDVRRASAADLANASGHFTDLLTDGDVVVQRFVPEITAGERSIAFFDGEFSHAWNSLTNPDDVTDFEGHDVDYDPPSSIRREAAAVLEAARAAIDRDHGSLTYARVDYVHRGSDLLLMELELIEPYLGLTRGEDAVERFADAVDGYFGPG